MSDTREILRRGIGDFAPGPEAYERVLRRLERKRRTKRIVAGAVAAAIVLIGSLAFLRSVVRTEQPLVTDEPVAVGNGKIAYRDGYQIVVIEPDGSGRVQLTSGRYNNYPNYPAWSADGSKIAFVAYDHGETSLFTMNADGSGKTLVQGVTDRIDGFMHPSWSPDGTQLVFMAGLSGHGDRSIRLYVVNVDGSGLTKITRGRHQDWWPSWSPDGTKIAFVTGPVGTRRDLATMSPDGSNRTTLVRGSTNYADWSPDGSQILFTQNSRRGWDVFRINSDGTGRIRLTDSPGKGEFFPVYSPDGTQIAFRRSFDNWHNYIVTMVIGGTQGPRRVTEVAFTEDPLSWQPT